MGPSIFDYILALAIVLTVLTKNKLQVPSLYVGGYIPEKFDILKYQSHQLGSKLGKTVFFLLFLIFPAFHKFSKPQLAKPRITRAACFQKLLFA